MEIFLTYILPVLLGLTIGYLLIGRKKVAKDSIEVLDPETFKKNMRKGQLIDIRKPEDFKKDRIKGARNFSVGYLKSKNQTKVRRDIPLYLYCDNGRKSLRAARKLAKKNYKKIYVLAGGKNAYDQKKDVR